MSTVLDKCSKCDGSGLVPQVERVACPVCHGTGQFMDSPCLGCGGSGKIELQDKSVCPVCDGAG
jgi:DnaJ-class molecular chaperone